MKNLLLNIVFFLSVVICCGQETTQGYVIKVADGDTFTVLINKKQYRIRVAEIDCPEKGQPFSNKAKQFTSDLIFNKVVDLKIRSKDRYGRLVANVFVGTVDLSGALLLEGLAVHYKKYSKNKLYAFLEKQAKENKKGIWSLDYFELPEQFRRKHK